MCTYTHARVLSISHVPAAVRCPEGCVCVCVEGVNTPFTSEDVIVYIRLHTICMACY